MRLGLAVLVAMSFGGSVFAMENKQEHGGGSSQIQTNPSIVLKKGTDLMKEPKDWKNRTSYFMGDLKSKSDEKDTETENEKVVEQLKKADLEYLQKRAEEYDTLREEIENDFQEKIKEIKGNELLKTLLTEKGQLLKEEEKASEKAPKNYGTELKRVIAKVKLAKLFFEFLRYQREADVTRDVMEAKAQSIAGVETFEEEQYASLKNLEAQKAKLQSILIKIDDVLKNISALPKNDLGAEEGTHESVHQKVEEYKEEIDTFINSIDGAIKEKATARKTYEEENGFSNKISKNFNKAKTKLENWKNSAVSGAVDLWNTLKNKIGKKGGDTVLVKNFETEEE